jgi:hypothetical protein
LGNIEFICRSSSGLKSIEEIRNSCKRINRDRAFEPATSSSGRCDFITEHRYGVPIATRLLRGIEKMMTTELRLITFAYLSFTVTALAATQPHLNQLVLPAPTITNLGSPNGLALAPTSVMLTINVAGPNGVPGPDGIALLSDGKTPLASVPVVNGSASFPVNFSSIGSHELSACYGGAGNYSPSCGTLNFLALAPYTLQQTHQSGTAIGSATFTDMLKVIPAPGFVGAVQLECKAVTGNCSLSSSSLSFVGNGKPQAVTTSFTPSASMPVSGVMILPLLGTIGLILRQKRKTSNLLCAMIGAILLFGLVGCGPLVAFPYDPPLSMSVIGTSSNYSQSVTYQIAVDPLTANQ